MMRSRPPPAAMLTMAGRVSRLSDRMWTAPGDTWRPPTWTWDTHTYTVDYKTLYWMKK